MRLVYKTHRHTTAMDLTKAFKQELRHQNEFGITRTTFKMNTLQHKVSPLQPVHLQAFRLVQMTMAQGIKTMKIHTILASMGKSMTAGGMTIPSSSQALPDSTINMLLSNHYTIKAQKNLAGIIAHHPSRLEATRHIPQYLLLRHHLSGTAHLHFHLRLNHKILATHQRNVVAAFRQSSSASIETVLYANP